MIDQHAREQQQQPGDDGQERAALAVLGLGLRPVAGGGCRAPRRLGLRPGRALRVRALRVRPLRVRALRVRALGV